ncbi:MAG TPA: PilN domain-containing protein [Rhodoblastus sp.]|nr:PilN domain-containing protein [Rhodoblastus sp.]
MASTGGLMTREVNLASLQTALRRFLAWERAECRALLPPAVLNWLMGRGAREGVVKAGASELVLAAGPGAQEVRIAGGEIRETSLDAALARRGLSRKAAALVLEMPAAAFLTRAFDIPAAASGQAAQIVAAEIERRTPFRRDEVLAGQDVAPHEAKGKARVRMILLRRDLIAPALENCGLAPGDLAAIRAEGLGAGAPIISLNQGAETDRNFQRLALALVALALLLVAAGIGATFWRQCVEAEALDARIAEMSARAARVRQVADGAAKESRLLTALHETRLKAAPLTEIWEEISRLTPDSAFLTDLRLSESKSGERSVDLTGFAQSAVGLPLLFDHSPLFSEAALTAPITADPKERRESFSLRLKTRPAPQPQPVVIEGNKP